MLAIELLLLQVDYGCITFENATFTLISVHHLYTHHHWLKITDRIDYKLFSRSLTNNHPNSISA